ncbi:NDUFA12-domain-containing protein [Ramicandelaber brevisporus]|nr:NDUFA12-domain-containing protein [Ramicandelaber brevisporus]
MSNRALTIGRVLRNTRQVGVRDMFKVLLTLSDFKAGTLIGTDAQGNKYYENYEEQNWRERWVLPKNDSTFDPSMIPPEWNRWLTKKSNVSPTAENVPMIHAWQNGAVGAFNYTGTPQAYRPYNTTAPKYASWQPAVQERVSTN